MKNSVFLLCVIFLFSCGSEQPKAEPNQSADKVIAEFKADMAQYCDSSNYYMDRALEMIVSGVHPDSLPETISAKMESLEKSIGLRSKEFLKTAQELKIERKTIAPVKQELDSCIFPLQRKFNKLKEAGAKL